MSPKQEEKIEDQPAGPSMVRRSARFFLIVLALLIIFIAGGFVQFARTVASSTPQPDSSADGIIALTGGQSRISDAIELLEDGRGQRLLISGVYRATTRSEIARVNQIPPQLITCCIDLDYGALNTLGNAQSARQWADKNGFKSLLIVTSAYHMPRSLMELARIAPDIEFVPYPVRTERLDLDRWWADSFVMRVMIAEYSKYLLARLHIRVGTPLLKQAGIASIR